jgi:hypothetical protein
MRQPVPDLLKGVAVIAMIQVHIMEQLARPEILQGPAGKVSLFLGGPFAAPVFMAVMGYFAAASAKGPWKKMIRGTLLLALGFILNIGLNFRLLYGILTHRIYADPLPYLFGVDILFLAGLALIIIGILELALKRRALAALSLAVLIPAVTPLMQGLPEPNRYVQAFIAGPAGWSYFPLFPWLAYPLAGYAWKKVQTEMTSHYAAVMKNMLYVRIVAAVLFLALAAPSLAIITDLPHYYHHGILLFAWMAGFMVIWTWMAEKIAELAHEAKVIAFIRWLGIHVTLVYVVQWLIIGNLAYHFHDSQYLLQALAWFAAILAATSLITYLMLRIYRTLKTHLHFH